MPEACLHTDKTMRQRVEERDGGGQGQKREQGEGGFT